MAEKYTFWHMLSDVIFNGNKVSGGKNNKNEDDGYSPSDGYSGDISSPHTSRDFNPSESAGEAFRSVFGDDNRS